MSKFNKSDLTDEQIVALFQQGEKHLFDILVLKYQSRVQSIISRFLRKDTASIEDIAQEAFINAYNALDKFRSDSQFYTWLYRIAINCAKNYLRSNAFKHRASDVSIDDEDLNIDAVSIDILDQPDLNIEYQQLNAELKSALNELPQEMQDVIVMRELSGKSYEEIAKILDCPVGTVRSRLFRAREKLFELVDFSIN